MEQARSDARGGFCMGAKLMLEIMLEGPGDENRIKEPLF